MRGQDIDYHNYYVLVADGMWKNCKRSILEYKTLLLLKQWQTRKENTCFYPGNGQGCCGWSGYRLT